MDRYLSVVVPFFDDHREHDPLNRLQISVTALLDQCRRYRIPSELIIVEWNPAAYRPSLTETLCVTAKPSPCAVRIVEVPAAMNSRGLTLDEVIAKNVGIRRARGRFVLATNIGALMSDEVMRFIADDFLRYGTLEPDDIAAMDGSLALGDGWLSRELAGSKPFRWFDNNAEIRVYADGDSERVLALDIEPGPGVNFGPTTLDILDDHESKILSVQLAARSVVNIPLPDRRPVRLRLRVSDGGRRLWRDPRPMNARVLRCGLYEAPVIARSWKLPQRIWWVLTRSMGSSLLPEPKNAEGQPRPPHQAICGDFTMLAREEWFELRGYPEDEGAQALPYMDAIQRACDSRLRGTPATFNRDDWGLGAEELKETLLIESWLTGRRPAAKVAVDLIGLPLVWFFRSLPRPPLPEPGKFGDFVAEQIPTLPLENPPKISIVTPSYQQGLYLEWTLRSVLEQEYSNLDYVVMDGGSTDETGDILLRYKDRLTYCESAPDKGQADAVARGFEHTTGEIMAYLNSDDVLAPGALDFAARFFAVHPQVDAIYSHRVFIDEGNMVTRYWILPPHHTWMMQRWDYIPQETCFWRRRIYEQVGGIDSSFQFALDYDLFVRFMQQGRMERVNRFLGAFREHTSSKTVLQEGAHPEVARVQEKHGIRVADWQRLPQLAQFELLNVRSTKFAARGTILPGALAGIGYNYDLVWGGRLNGPRSSSRSSSDIHPI